MHTWNEFLWDWKHIRMRWDYAVEQAGEWAGGRTNGRSVGRSDHIFRIHIYVLGYMYRMCVHKRFIIRWCFGTGSKNLRLTLLTCLPHCLFIILCNAIPLTPSSSSSPKPSPLFRYQFISFTKYCNIFFYEYLIMCMSCWRKKGVNFPFIYLPDFGWLHSKKYKK